MNDIIFTGHITWIGPRVEGVSAKTGKTYAKRDFIITETDTQYPKSMVLTAWRDQVLTTLEQLVNAGYSTDMLFIAHIDVAAKPTASDPDRYYNDLRCWKIEDAKGGQQ